MEHTFACVERLVVDIVLASRMVVCKRVVVQTDYVVEVLTHIVVGIVVAKKVVDRMVLCFGMVDFGLYMLVVLFLEKEKAWK